MIYKNLFIISVLLFINIWIVNSKNCTIYAITFTYYEDGNSYHRPLIEGFNEYSKEKGLGINMELVVLTPLNSTSDIENYGTTIESLLVKKSEKYDIYFFYAAYSKKYYNHFIDLRNYLPKESIEAFDEDIIKHQCTSYNNKLVGLPIHIDIGTLFSNIVLLSKYQRNVPKTWDELLSTSKYIYEEEKKLNNTIMAYNGLFNDFTGGVSIYEFINSFRKSNAEPYPKITSETTKKALKYLKEMKNEIGEGTFNLLDDVSLINLFTANGLFLKYWYMGHRPEFKATALPGYIEGVSGSYIISTNLGVSNYVSKERQEAAIEFMKFITLKETHKKYIINNYFFSGITELYDDDEVCNVIECDIIKDIYPFSFMDNDVNLFGNDDYQKKYREFIFKYLYDDEPLDDVLKKIEDISKVYTYSMKTEESNLGLILLIIFIVLFTIVLLSIIFLFIKKLENKFRFLSKDSWIITTLGSLMLMSSVLTLYGDVTNETCHLRTALINVGFILSICPSLHKLVMNFPIRNKISLWIKDNKYIFILIIMIFTMGLSGIFAISSYSFNKLVTSDGKNYLKCTMNDKFGSVVHYLIQIYDFIIILISLALIFLEWNLKETYLDVNFLATALFTDTLSLILLIVIDNIKFKGYVIYNALLTVTILFFSTANHFLLYLIRVIPFIGNKGENFEDSKKYLGKVSKTSSKKFSVINTSSSNASSSNVDNPSITSSEKYKLIEFSKKIINCHNQTSISEN